APVVDDGDGDRLPAVRRGPGEDALDDRARAGVGEHALRLLELEPEHVERGRARLDLDAATVAPEAALDDARPARPREREEDEPDGLLGRPAVGAGDPGDPDPVVGAR